MGIFKRKEKREAATPTADTAAKSDFYAMLTTEDTLTIDNALQVPCFAACVSFIANLAAMLPVKLYREQDGKTKQITDDVRVKYLNEETNDLLDANQLKCAFFADYLVRGNGYIYKSMRRNTCAGLYYVDARSVSTIVGIDPIFKTASLNVMGKPYDPSEFIKLLRQTRDGVTGTGLYKQGKKALSTAYNALVCQDYLVKHINRGGYIQAKNEVDGEALTKLRARFKAYASGADEDVLVLNKDLEYKETPANSEQMELDKIVNTTARAICAMFGLSEDVISGKATDEQFSSAMKTAVQPVIEPFQTALNRELLLESEKQSMYFAVDMTELLKGDTLKRYQAYEIALRNNFMLTDEVRYKEDMSDLGFNYVKLGLDSVLLDLKNGTVYTPNTNQTAKLGEEINNSEKLTGDENRCIIEKRSNDNHDEKGRFAVSQAKMTSREISRVSSGILTDHPTLKADNQLYCYEYGNNFYVFSVNEPGSYNFHTKKSIEKNQAWISQVRKELYNE